MSLTNKKLIKKKKLLISFTLKLKILKIIKLALINKCCKQ